MLKPLPGTDLSEYAIHLLTKNDIGTVNQFLNADATKLAKLLRVNSKIITQLKDNLVRVYGPKAMRLRPQKSCKPYGTGIAQLDELLLHWHERFGAGSVWEICGPAGAGKTEFMYAVAVHYLCGHSGEVLFIDTKADFAGTRVRSLLRTRQTTKRECGRIMQRLKVIQALTANRLSEILQLLLSDLQAPSFGLILIDSLPALWLRYRAEQEKKSCKALLAKVACSIRKLASIQSMAFLVGNLSIGSHEADEFICNETTIEGLNEQQPSFVGGDNEALHPMLGQYWASVPTLRLSIEPHQHAYDAKVGHCQNTRLIKIIYSANCPKETQCIIQLNV